jgi:hypothetical protein
MAEQESHRASDADREQAILALREHLLAGRLTLEEFSDRVEIVLQARFAGELANVQRDLPAPAASTAQPFAPVPAGQGTPAGEVPLADLTSDPALAVHVAPRRKPTRISLALLSHIVRRGRLRLHRWTLATSVLGDLDLDLREATVDTPQTTVAVIAVLANVDVYVPEGVNVEVGGISMLGHTRDHGRDVVRPDTPTIYVRIMGCFGTVDVWRVPADVRGSYGEILRQIRERAAIAGPAETMRLTEPPGPAELTGPTEPPGPAELTGPPEIPGPRQASSRKPS